MGFTFSCCLSKGQLGPSLFLSCSFNFHVIFFCLSDVLIRLRTIPPISYISLFFFTYLLLIDVLFGGSYLLTFLRISIDLSKTFQPCTFIRLLFKFHCSV